MLTQSIIQSLHCRYTLVFPFSDCFFPSASGYTGTTVTLYSVSGCRFLRTVLVDTPDTWAWRVHQCRHTLVSNQQTKRETNRDLGHYRVWSTSGNRHVDEIVLTNISICWVPSHSQRVYSWVCHLEVLHTSHRFCVNKTDMMNPHKRIIRDPL